MDNEQAITIQRWISLANNDIRTARKALDDPDPITNTACLHTQQCAEKALKAVLASQGQHIGKMHDLEILLEKCLLKDPEFEVLRKDVSPLNPYSVTPAMLMTGGRSLLKKQRKRLPMPGRSLIS